MLVSLCLLRPHAEQAVYGTCSSDLDDHVWLDKATVAALTSKIADRG